MFVAPTFEQNPRLRNRLRNRLNTAEDIVDGLFIFEHPSIKGVSLFTIASNGSGWEHVSVSLRKGNATIQRCPTWLDMCFVKSQFWGEEDQVIEYHPKKSEYVNCHPFVLHLWRPIGVEIPSPPSIMVGPK